LEREPQRAVELQPEMDAARRQAEDSVRQTMEREAAERAAGMAAQAKKTEPKFTIKLQSNAAPTIAAARATLTWLLMHPLVVLDPGDRWVVSGIVAVLLSFDLKENADGGVFVDLDFAFRAVRVSGYKWSNYEFKAPEVPAEEQQAALNHVRSMLEEFTSPEFLTAAADVRSRKVSEVLAAGDALARLRAATADVMRQEQILRNEARKHHQRQMSLKFVRHLDELCRRSGAGGDPIVIVGAGGGGAGRRGRQQAKHDVLVKTLAGFFTVVVLAEHCTSKKTTCCHQDAHAPRSKGRSRGCKNKACAKPQPGDSPPKPPWWDRDTGAAW